ncbi:HDIG domain-containing protein [Desulfonema magnum]|uniref:HDIG domain-containing protein n=1 Tax=Desulfonema magnum TaxID=45655 RepID=A0A975GNL7_9BACT|nr:HDIG domain-containing protein [Desulfonema magnum]
MLPLTVSLHELIDVVITTLDARDPYTLEHSFRVAEYSERISEDMGLDADMHQRVHIAAHLHDIGKIGVSDAVLNKPGKLTNAEMKEIQSHSRIGYNILSRIPMLREISEIVLHHHERFDGKGYPRGLMGDKIPLESRIIAVADAFDAMTSDRPYRKGMPSDDAVREINRHKETQFCPLIVNSFNRVAPQFFLYKSSDPSPNDAHFAFFGHEDLMLSKMVCNGKNLDLSVSVGQTNAEMNRHKRQSL